MIRERLGLKVIETPGRTGQFDVVVDGEVVATRGGNFLTRSLGMGYPDLEAVVADLEKRHASRP